MEYLTVEQAREAPGLRLALTCGVPGPWSEAAKAVFALRNVEYQPVQQLAGDANEALVDWTGHRNAPVAVYENEAPRVRWLEILDLAERLGSGPSLFPADRDDRIYMVGLINEFAGESGMAWNARLLMLQAGVAAAGTKATENPMYEEYGFDANLIESSIASIEEFLTYLAARMKTQQAAGSSFLVGDSLTAADVYWACFSNMLEPLPADLCPMPDGLRGVWGVLAQSINGYDPVLIEQRDKILADHFTLPMEF